MVKKEESLEHMEKVEKLLAEEDAELAKKFRGLSDIIAGYRTAVIAFSGGLDSSLLAYLGGHLLARSLCVTADSPTLPRSELAAAREFARMYKLDHCVVQHNELADGRFVKNDEKRCFYCKEGLFKALDEIRRNEGYDRVLDGSNLDDLDDYRPGREAAEKSGVKSPLMEAGLRKSDIRALSRALCLPTWDKPQMACLSSRFPRNTMITEEGLRKVESAEKLLKDMGYRDVRVRVHGDIARIEIGPDEAVDLEEMRSLVPAIKDLGFRYVALDLEGFRTGSLNE